MHKSTMSLLGLPDELTLPGHGGQQTMRRWSVHEPVPAITLVGGQTAAGSLEFSLTVGFYSVYSRTVGLSVSCVCLFVSVVMQCTV